MVADRPEGEADQDRHTRPVRHVPVQLARLTEGAVPGGPDRRDPAADRRTSAAAGVGVTVLDVPRSPRRWSGVADVRPWRQYRLDDGRHPVNVGKDEQRMIAHAAEMTVLGGAFLRPTGLRAMARADRTVHVQCDPLGRHRGVSPIAPPISPLTGYVRRRTAIVGCRRHPGLEPTHPAGRRSLGINATPSDHLPHHRIERRTVRVVHIIISGRSPEDRPRNADGCGRFAYLREDRRQYRAIPGSRPTPGTATGHRRNRSSSHGIPAAADCRNRA